MADLGRGRRHGRPDRRPRGARRRGGDTPAQSARLGGPAPRCAPRRWLRRDHQPRAGRRADPGGHRRPRPAGAGRRSPGPGRPRARRLAGDDGGPGRSRRRVRRDRRSRRRCGGHSARRRRAHAHQRHHRATQAGRPLLRHPRAGARRGQALRVEPGRHAPAPSRRGRRQLSPGAPRRAVPGPAVRHRRPVVLPPRPVHGRRDGSTPSAATDRRRPAWCRPPSAWCSRPMSIRPT